MACCGKARRQLYQATPATRHVEQARAVAATNPVATVGNVILRFRGPGSTTVVGPVSGRRYHFATPGSCVQIDFRDRIALVRLPELTEVSG